MYKYKLIFLLFLLLFSFTAIATAGSAVDSYLEGTYKVCVYEDGYKVRVGITDLCPIIPGH
jgi:hypothetical protein